MHKQVIKSILDLIQKDINNNLIGTEVTLTDPETVYTMRTEKLALCLGILVMLKYRDFGRLQLEGYLTKDIEICLRKFPGWSTLLGSYKANGNHLLDEWYDQFFDNEYQGLSLSTVYETLLAYEWVWDTSGFHVAFDKASRNRSGAYYTPQQLADVSVRKVLDEMVFQKLEILNLSQVSSINEKEFFGLIELFSKIKVIDPSCGTGHFLKAVLGYFLNNVLPHHPKIFSVDQQKIVTNRLLGNLWGIDVDFIALEISKIELMIFSDITKETSRIANHFIHGNPLLPFNSISHEQVNKRKLTAAGFLYHPGLQIHSEDLFIQLEVGFDLVVGNPPWEKLRFEEKSFFRPWAPHISELSKKDDRAKEITNLKESSPLLYKYYTQFISNLETSKRLIQSNSYIFHSVAGELNTYALFTELVTHFINQNGKVCYVIKSALVVSPVNSGIFKYLVDGRLITHCYDFINKKNIFAIDSRERFCTLILGRHDHDYFYYRSGLTDPNEVFHGADLCITPSILKMLNPLTEMIPSVANPTELNFLIDMHTRHPVLEQVFPECKYGRLVHYTNHAEFIEKESSDHVLPIYEGKFIELFDGRYSTYEGLSSEQRYGNKSSSIAISDEAKKNPKHFPESRFFIKKEKWASLSKNYTLPYSLMWRSLTSASNRRTCIATILPHLPASQSVQFLQLNNLQSLTLLAALFNSIIFDYMVRLKLNGIDLTQKILKQIAVPKKERFEEELLFLGVKSTLYQHIAVRVAWLLSDDERLHSFCQEIHPKEYPFYDATDRKRVLSEIDFLIAKAYKISDAVFKRIIKTFPSFYSSDELQCYFDK